VDLPYTLVIPYTFAYTCRTP